MEKLQAALRTAREKRGDPSAPTPKSRDATAPPAPQRAATTPAREALWEALDPFETADGSLRRSRIVTRKAGREATPFDILRTKVLLQMRQNGWTRLAITSPMPQSGKTTTACNLALGVGRQKDLKAILFDLDLRDPSIHKFFRHEPPMALRDVLAGDVRFEDQALRVGDNVAVSMTNRPEPDPTRLLLSDAAAVCLDDIQSRYRPDIMIFDMPSVLTGDDTRAFLKNVDCALIVTRANATRYGQFDTCEREVAEHTNVLGVVLNAVRHGGTPGDAGRQV